MRKITFCAIVFLCFYFLNAAYTQQVKGPQKWEDEVRAFEKSDSLASPPSNGVLFVGSSSIRLWKDIQSKFPGKKVLGRGIGGSEIPDITYYANRIIFPYKPKKIFIYCGGNDINAGKSPEEVFTAFSTLYGEIKQHLPDSRIYYISIQTSPARWEKTEAFKRTNELIRAFLAKKKEDMYVDVSPILLDQQGKPKPEFFIGDQLHMNEKGYERWAKVLKYYVDQQ